MSENKNLIVPIIMVAIFIVIAGSLFHDLSFNVDEESPIGDYTLYDGTNVRLDGDQARETGLPEIAKELSITYFENGIVRGNIGGLEFVGSYWGKYAEVEISSLSTIQINNHICAVIEKNTISISSVTYNDGAVKMASYITYTKDGTGAIPPKYDPIWKEGQTFKSFESFYYDNGEISSYDRDFEIEVLKNFGMVNFIKCTWSDGNETDVRYKLVSQVENSSFQATASKTTNLSKIFILGDAVSYQTDVCSDGEYYAYTFNLSSDGTKKEIASTDALVGKSYRVNGLIAGTEGEIMKGDEFSLTFADTKGNMAVVSWFGKTMPAHVTKITGGYFISLIAFDQDAELVLWITGAVTDDSKSLVAASTIKVGRESGASCLSGKLVNGTDSIIGAYKASMFIAVSDGFEYMRGYFSGCDRYLFIDTIDENGAVIGTWGDKKFVGLLVSEGVVRFTTTTDYPLSKEYDAYCTLKFEGGVCSLFSGGRDDEGSAVCMEAAFYKQGAKNTDARSDVENKTISPGDKFTSFHWQLMTNGEIDNYDTDEFELECISENVDLYSFELRFAPFTYHLYGWYESEDTMLLVINGVTTASLCTISIHEKGICFCYQLYDEDESVTAVIRMSADGTAFPLPVIENYNGTYACTDYTYTVTDGYTVDVEKSAYNIEIANQNYTLLQIKSSGAPVESKCIQAHILIDEHNNKKMLSFDSDVDYKGHVYHTIYICEFSQDGKELIIYGTGIADDDSIMATKMICKR